MKRPELLAFFEQRQIETHRLPLTVLEHARQIIMELEGGQPYWKLHGKRLRAERRQISIPVGRKLRLLAVDQAGVLRVRCLLSHATYNHQT